LSLDPATGEYQIDMNGKLDADSTAMSTTFDQNIGGNPSTLHVVEPPINGDSIFKPADLPVDANIFITLSSSAGSVNSSTQGLAGDGQWIDSEELYFNFTDPALGASVSVDFQGGSSSGLIEYTLHDADGILSPQTGTLLVSNGVLTEIPLIGGITSVSQIDFSNPGGTDAVDYRISGISAVTQELEGNIDTSFNLGVIDNDGDTASSTLDVHFEGSEILEGINGVDDAIGGSALNETLDGGTGDDILTGGSGADTFKVAEGDDTITDYDLTGIDGDVVDISNVFETGNTLEVSKNDDGTAKLSVFDGVTEKGSVSFDNIDFDTDLTTGDELNSLLGQVDVDDGIV